MLSRGRLALASLVVVLLASVSVIVAGQAWLHAQRPTTGGWWFVVHAGSDRDTAIRSAADTAVTSILSYDYRRLRAGREDTLPLLTGDAKDQYLALQRPLAGSAPRLHSVVQAEVRSLAVLASDADSARVLLFVDQTSTSTKLSRPQLDQSRVLVTMQRTGDRWLVATLVAI